MNAGARRARVFVCSTPVDMRKSYDTLAAVVRDRLGRDLLDGDLFVFVGRRRRTAKVLYWDGTGTCVLQKRLEKGLFAAPWSSKRHEWTTNELALFLEGSELVGRIAISPPPWSRDERKIVFR
jgi:transposase